MPKNKLKIKKIEPIHPESIYDGRIDMKEVSKNLIKLKSKNKEVRSLIDSLRGIHVNLDDRLYYINAEIKQAIRSYRHSLKKGNTPKYAWYTISERGYTYKTELEVFDSRLATIQRLRRSKLSQLRVNRRNEAYQHTRVGKSVTVNSIKQGKVHTESGIFLRLQERMKTELIRQGKKPIYKSNHIGVEIECLIPKEHCSSTDSLGDTIYKAGLAKSVQLKYDSSIRSESGCFGVELAILAPQSKIKSTLTKVCSILNELEAKVNSSCGVHVHLDIRNRDWRSTAKKLVTAQPLLFAMQPSSRQSNQYCYRTGFQDSDSMQRYGAINLAAVNDHNTIEVRLHSGSTNAKKLLNWIELLVAIADSDLDFSKARGFDSIDAWLDALKVSKNLKSYVKARVERFTGSTSLEPARTFVPEYGSDDSEDSLREVECPNCDEYLGEYYVDDEIECDYCSYEFIV